jgi:hypothetical protein
MADPKTYIYSITEMLWSRSVLATHSMTGKVSNAHKDKEAKPCLDQVKVIALCGKLNLLFFNSTTMCLKMLVFHYLAGSIELLSMREIARAMNIIKA